MGGVERRWGGEQGFVCVGDGLVADPLVDAVRGWVGEVGVEEAEASALFEQGCGEVGDECAGVASAAKLGWRVDGADADAVGGGAPEARERDRLAVVPEHDSAFCLGEAVVEDA